MKIYEDYSDFEAHLSAVMPAQCRPDGIDWHVFSRRLYREQICADEYRDILHQESDEFSAAYFYWLRLLEYCREHNIDALDIPRRLVEHGPPVWHDVFDRIWADVVSAHQLTV